MIDRPAVLVLGGTGQIGHEVRRSLAWIGPMSAPTRQDANLERPDVVRDLVRRVKPTVVVNAAGYTAVDAAESNVDACNRLNIELPRVLAEECRRIGALLVHFSSDYVFDGTKGAPYIEDDDSRPLCAYGASKLGGEIAVTEAAGAHLIFRTSWVYAARGRNFPLAILRLAREREELRVVDDQIGAPTSAPAIATAVSEALRVVHSSSEIASGVYHLSASGSTTWFEFAKTILAADPRANEQICRSVVPIATAEYPTAARRPAYSVLDNTKLVEGFGVRLPSWREQWREVAVRLAHGGTSDASSAVVEQPAP
jgi:dTDP-4-dehydrorhamnose reductase